MSRGSCHFARAAKVAAICASFLLTASAHAGPQVAREEITLCTSLANLNDAQARWDAQDRQGIAQYFGGSNPACLRLQKGETVDALDRSGAHLQVVTRQGTPRFIGWGSSQAFEVSP